MSFLSICILIVDNPPMRAFRLALVTIFQFMENLTDRQAADAVRSRLDWKYALSLELTDPGFDHTVTSLVSDSLSGSDSRRTLLGSGADAVQRTRMAQSAWPAAN
jgi:L-ribulose-5-phosphate 3-epimerase UlaE